MLLIYPVLIINSGPKSTRQKILNKVHKTVNCSCLEVAKGLYFIWGGGGYLPKSMEGGIWERGRKRSGIFVRKNERLRKNEEEMESKTKRNAN
jgi:hypothetical protein